MLTWAPNYGTIGVPLWHPYCPSLPLPLPPGAPPWRADTSSLRFTAGFALALVPREPSDEAMALHRGTLRFLAQHTADDPWAQAFRRPESLRGLVRRSLTGDDCPPDATALGLLVALAGLGGR